ncbi:uncharacterized protein LOC131155644 isoform X2 [Malania oleifera]|uniref:uncharacterized protein LOC131155644 isoform X2 n=1 Tax=Malania oleifera TaxID=397392 RepID=UPI0025ADA5C9|nr:uncharacterized protein LOC131155644 isoform X2 [Malania oleifera]
MAFLLSANGTILFAPTFPSSKRLLPYCSPSYSLSHPRVIIISASSSSTTETLPHLQVGDPNNGLPSAATARWSEFSRNVSGEWDGYGAYFSTDGKPIELPESVVPEAFREWEVKVFDWQTQCPTLAQPEELLVTYKLIKLLPTVGCEADAATQYSIDERKIGGSDNRISAFAYQSSGCYVAVWLMENPQIDGTSSLLELEHCLVDPKNRESRVRIIQSVRVDNTKMVLQNVKVFREQWYGPFRNGEQLGGCAVHESGFASTDTMKGSEINGVWQGPVSVARFQSSEANIFQEFTDESVQKLVRDERDIIFLPKQLWCSLNEAVGGETCGEVGWMLDSGHAITSRCVFSSDAKLKEITIASETAEGLDQL